MRSTVTSMCRHLVLTLALTITVFTGAQAQSANDVVAPRGPFGIASGSQNTVWRIDQSTGAVSFCVRDTVSSDPAVIKSRPAICSPWSR